METFVHPHTKQILEKDSEGNLFAVEGTRRDVYRCYEGCYDFSSASSNTGEARQAYDEFYAQERVSSLKLATVSAAWRERTVPWRKTMLESIGSLRGRRVLLLGNGSSYIEFYFLHLGADVVFTDLSLVAARRAQSEFRNSELWEPYRGHIEFHAVDALHLPFPDRTFDVIYGTKLVGFLENLERFFCEVSRCLRPGGVCRFCDDAYSPAWEGLKRRLVYPMRARFRRGSKCSVTKVRADSTACVREDGLAPLVDKCGFSRFVFIPEYFFLRAAQLSWATLFGWDPKRERYVRPLLLMMKWIDDRLARSAWVRRNRLALTWGFDK
jgi:SAM-dependent methyltransferase